MTEVVKLALDAEPAWVIAKGGITSHDVAVQGLGIRRAEVLGQLLPGMVSVFRPIEADPRAVGMPYVVFAGNVGDERTLAEIVDRFREPDARHRDGVLRARPARVAAITTYTLESTRAIVRAAERLEQPVLLPAGASSYGAVGREPLAAAALAAARAAPVPVGVHLDHCRDPAEIDACLALGYSSVMIDGSHLEFEENVALTRPSSSARTPPAPGSRPSSARSRATRTLGDAEAGRMTDPDQAAEFAERTGVDALAVAVGNVHGFTPEPVRLDLERLRAIAAACPRRSSCTARPACPRRTCSARSPRAS